AAAKTPKPADDGGVLGEFAVAGERREILEKLAGIVDEVRPVGMARHLGLLPGRQLGIDVREGLARAGLESADLVIDADRIAFAAEGPQLLDFALEIGDRLFEIEVDAHPDPERPARVLTLAKPAGN